MSVKRKGRKWAVMLSAALVGLVAMSAAVAYAARDGSSGAVDVDEGFETVVRQAPIEDVRLDVLETDPPQYMLQVISILPTGCDRFEGYDLALAGNDIVVTVSNRVPAVEAAVTCAMGLRNTWSTIQLGSDFASGETYRVIVNGELAAEFTAE